MVSRRAGLSATAGLSCFHMIEHISKTTSATDFKIDTWLCMGNAEQAQK